MSSKSQTDIRKELLNDVVEEHRGKLLRVVRGLLRDNNEAEDVLQDVFAEYVELYDLETAIESVGAWLVRVAQNKVLDRFRRRKTQTDYQLFVQASSEGEASSESRNEWLRERFRDEIIEAISLLPAEQRDVFIKNELEGKSFEDIAKETGVNVNTLLSRKRYAVLSLRDHLKEIYDELE